MTRTPMSKDPGGPGRKGSLKENIPKAAAVRELEAALHGPPGWSPVLRRHPHRGSGLRSGVSTPSVQQGLGWCPDGLWGQMQPACPGWF